MCKAKCHRNARPGSLPHLNLSNLSIGSPLPRRATVSAGAVSPSRRHHDTSKPVQIRAHLFVGSEKDAHDLKTLDEFRITHILNVTSHVPNKFEAMDDGDGSGGGGEAAQPQNKKEETIAEASEGAPAAPRRRRFTYKRIAVQDNWTQDLSAHFEEAIQFISKFARWSRRGPGSDASCMRPVFFPRTAGFPDWAEAPRHDVIGPFSLCR